MRRSRTCPCKLTRVVIFLLKRVSVCQEGRVEETRSVRGVRGRNELSAQILPGLHQTASTVLHPQVSSALVQTETRRSILTFPSVLCGNANLNPDLSDVKSAHRITVHKYPQVSTRLIRADNYCQAESSLQIAS